MALYLRQRRKHNQERGVQPCNGSIEVKLELRIWRYVLERPTDKLGQLRNKLLCLRQLGQPDKVQGQHVDLGGKKTGQVCRIGHEIYGFELRRQRTAHRYNASSELCNLGRSHSCQHIQQRNNPRRRQNPVGESNEYKRDAFDKRSKEHKNTVMTQTESAECL